MTGLCVCACLGVGAVQTAVPCVPAGVFSCPLVVTMRPIPASMLDAAVKVTHLNPQAHGAPVHIGDPGNLHVLYTGYYFNLLVHNSALCAFQPCSAYRICPDQTMGSKSNCSLVMSQCSGPVGWLPLKQYSAAVSNIDSLILYSLYNFLRLHILIRWYWLYFFVF